MHSKHLLIVLFFSSILAYAQEEYLFNSSSFKHSIIEKRFCESQNPLSQWIMDSVPQNLKQNILEKEPSKELLQQFAEGLNNLVFSQNKEKIKKNIDLVCQKIGCSWQDIDSIAVQKMFRSYEFDLPTEMEPVASQWTKPLSDGFSSKGYQMLDTSIMKIRENEWEVSDTLQPYVFIISKSKENKIDVYIDRLKSAGTKSLDCGQLNILMRMLLDWHYKNEIRKPYVGRAFRSVDKEGIEIIKEAIKDNGEYSHHDKLRTLADKLFIINNEKKQAEQNPTMQHVWKECHKQWMQTLDEFFIENENCKKLRQKSYDVNLIVGARLHDYNKWWFWDSERDYVQKKDRSICSLEAMPLSWQESLNEVTTKFAPGFYVSVDLQGNVMLQGELQLYVDGEKMAKETVKARLTSEQNFWKEKLSWEKYWAEISIRLVNIKSEDSEEDTKKKE